MSKVKGIFCFQRLVIWGAIVLAFTVNSSLVLAQHDHYGGWSHYDGHGCCPSCGCEEEPKTKMYLVRVYKKVDIPNYASQPQNTFYPAKGFVNHQRYANDSFIVNRKDRCGQSCLGCETVNGCQTNQGMTAAGCCKLTDTCKPVSVSTHYIPVLKWKKVEMCPKCSCDYGLPNEPKHLPADPSQQQSPPSVVEPDSHQTTRNYRGQRIR